MKNTKLKRLNNRNYNRHKSLPIKIVQFGEGNFLRAFVDYIIDELNDKTNFNAGVVVIQPLPNGLSKILNEQDGLYHLFMEGIKDGAEIQESKIISCIQDTINPYNDYEKYMSLAEQDSLEFLISNTTEAGIVFDERDALTEIPHKTFPAKVTALLYRRYLHFKGSESKGLTIIPCELINNNSDVLKKCILNYADLWQLEDGFTQWIKECNSFHNTLVDRIVPGYPKHDLDTYQNKLNFEDKLIVSAEVFLLWVIEGDDKLKSKIPFNKIDENILIVRDVQPYRTRKVRILNGAHTSMVPFSILFGNETVKETIEDDFTGDFVRNLVYEEIIPTLSLPEKELLTFANDVFDRFKNPFIKHELSTIALNSISKFKVRVLPSLCMYHEKFNKVPLRLTFALACLIRFYKGELNGQKLPLNDNPEVIAKIQNIWEQNDYQKISKKILGDIDLWGTDLRNILKFESYVAFALEKIDSDGIEVGYRKFSKKFGQQNE